MITEKVSIPVGHDHVSAMISAPGVFGKDKTGVIIAHGAAGDMNNPLIVHMADGLASAGFAALRFNFPYSQKGRRSPDNQQTLYRAWQAVFEFFRENCAPDKIAAAGKSMGGRIASQMAAEGLLPADRLIFLGYPLHPPNKKDSLRDAHLYNIKIPMLFFAGTRDALCDLALLKKVLARFEAEWSLEIIAGGDHSFGTPKALHLTQLQIYDQILEKTVFWLKSGKKEKR